MRTPISRLASLVRVRGLLERRALGELARAQRRLAEAEEVCRRRREAYHARAGADGPLDALQLLALRLQGIAAHGLVAQAEAGVADAGAEHARQRSAYSRASSGRRSAERAEERRRASARAAAEVARQRALDELVLLRRARVGGPT